MVICLSTAKMTATGATYSYEVVRTRMQTQRMPLLVETSPDGMIKLYPQGGFIHDTKTIIQEEGGLLYIRVSQSI